MRNEMTTAQGAILGVLKAWPSMKIPWSYIDHLHRERAFEERATRCWSSFSARRNVFPNAVLLPKSVPKIFSWRFFPFFRLKNLPKALFHSHINLPEFLLSNLFFCSSELPRFLLQLSLSSVICFCCATEDCCFSGIIIPRSTTLSAPEEPPQEGSCTVTESSAELRESPTRPQLIMEAGMQSFDRLLHDTNSAHSCPQRKILH
jgi:hypothetical protein